MLNNVRIRIYFFLIICLIFCSSCIQETKILNQDNQLSKTFFGSIRSPASFTVQMHPKGATRLVKGERVPIRLADLIKEQLRTNDMLESEDVDKNNINLKRKNKYVIIVEKNILDTSKSDFSKSFNDVMEKLEMSERSYIMEISVEEIIKNAKGEDVFGKRLALFATILHRKEEEVASDIVRSILDEII